MKNLCLLLFLPLAICCHAADSTQTIEVPSGSPLTIKPPAAWKVVLTQSAPAQPPSLAITVTNDPAINVKITFLGDKDGKLNTQEKIDQIVKIIGGKFAEKSVEKEVKVIKLDSKNGLGSYAQFTDSDLVGKPAPPGEFKVFAAGFIVIGQSAVSFTIVADSFDQPSYRDAFKFIQEGIVVKKD